MYIVFNLIKIKIFVYQFIDTKIMMRNAGTFYTPAQLNEQVFSGKESGEKAELYVFYLKNKLRQIHADVNVIEQGEAYALGE